MAGHEKKKKGGCLKGVLPIIMVAMVAVYAIYTYMYEDNLAKEYLRFERYFDGYFEKYLAVGKENLQPKPFRTGKLLVMKTSPDKYGVWLNPMFYDLPEEMKANNPDEVSTVVVMDYKKEVYLDATYEDSHVWNAYFTIVDWPSRSIIYRGMIEGEAPEGENQMGEGQVPSYELFDFIKALPMGKL